MSDICEARVLYYITKAMWKILSSLMKRTRKASYRDLGVSAWVTFVGGSGVFLSLCYVQRYMDAGPALETEKGHETHPSTCPVKWKFSSVQIEAVVTLVSVFGFCSLWRHPSNFCYPQLCWNQQVSSFRALQKCRAFLQMQVPLHTLQVRLIRDVGVSKESSLLSGKKT